MFEEIILPFITSEKGQRLGLLFAILMGALFFVTVFETLSAWRADFLLAHHPSIVVNDIPVEEGDAKLVAQIPAQHVFGQSAEDTGFLPITSLQLQLTGIVKSSPDNLSRVIISEAGHPGKVYSVGDMLVSGIRIYAVNEDGIVLEHAGRLEKLPLVRAALAFKNVPRSLWQADES